MKTDSVDGTRSLRRLLDVLRALGEHQEEGINLTALAHRCQLDTSTAHRLLSCLVQERFAHRNEGTKVYRLGEESLQLGMSSMKKITLVNDYLPLLKRLVRLTGQTAFLQIREGDFGVCLHVEEGATPASTFTTGVWGRWPLGVGAGGLAIMAGLADDEVQRIHQRNVERYSHLGLSMHVLAAHIARTRRHGYSEIRGTTTAGVSGIGFAFRTSKASIASISFGALTSQWTDGLRQQLVETAYIQIGDVADFLLPRD